MNEKLKEYHRYKNFSDCLLIVTALLLGVFLTLEVLLPGLENIRFASYMAEAVLVASVADFIAIYALSNRIGHIKSTGLIQKKRKDLIEGVCMAFKLKFMPVTQIVISLKAIRIVEKMSKMLSHAVITEFSPAIGKIISNILLNNKKKIAEGVFKAVNAYLGSFGPAEAIRKIHQFMKKKGWISQSVKIFLDRSNDYMQSPASKETIRKCVVQAISEVGDHENFIKRSYLKTGTFIAEKANILNAEELADSIHMTLRSSFEEAKTLQGQEIEALTIEMETSLSDLILNLAGNEKFIAGLSEWRDCVLKPSDFGDKIIIMIETIAKWFDDGKINQKEIRETFGVTLNGSDETEAMSLHSGLAVLLRKGLHELKRTDAFAQDQYEQIIEKFIQQEYNEILETVKDVLDKLSDENLVDKVNEVAGSSLQWLRISGALVGSIVGAVLFCVAEWPVLCLPPFAILMACALGIPFFRKRLVRFRQG